MKAKIKLIRDSKGKVLSVKYNGIKNEDSVDDYLKSTVVAARRKSATFSKIDESVMKRKFSI